MLSRNGLFVSLAILAASPAYFLRITGTHLGVEWDTLCFGAAIVGAAFTLSWGAEAAEHDIPRAVALIAVALLAVLPEYAVDAIFAYKAGQDPAFAPFAVANMTGSNRLLLGFGWPVVAGLAWFARRERVIVLSREDVLPLIFLSAATLYSFTLPLKGTISLVDTAVLLVLFLAYAVLALREHQQEPELVGPAAAIGNLPTVQRRAAVIALLVFSGVSIAISAEPFAEGLVHTGEKLQIDEFLLVQWLAPLASEAPEFLVAILLALRGKAVTALGLLLSSKVNQWTLLIGSLPVAFSFGAGQVGAFPLDQRQIAEVLLTAAQSFYGVAVLTSLSFSLAEAGIMFALFLTQFILGSVLRAGQHNESGAELEMYVFSGIYVLLGIIQIIRDRQGISAMVERLKQR